jgi:hypothetical protein
LITNVVVKQFFISGFDFVLGAQMFDCASLKFRRTVIYF